MSKIFKQVLSVLVKVAISVILLVVLFRMVGHENIFEVIRSANKPLLLLAFLVYSLGYVLCLFRWDMLLRAVDLRLPLSRVVISFSGGIFFNLFLPSTIGGDLMRSVDLSTHTKKPKEVIATILLDRLSGYIGLVLLALSSLVLGWKLLQEPSVLFSVAVITGLLIFILLVLFSKFFYSRINSLLGAPGAGKIHEMISSLHHEVHIFRQHKKVIVKNIILSIAVQTIAPLSFYISALALGLKISPVYFFVFLPVIGAITLLPLSIGGLGLRDATTIFFFAKAGVGKDLAFAMSLINFSFILALGAVGGLIYVLTIRHRRIQYNKPS
ncbi:MAG: lysylphosphatidylglycerol synthase transmembrane domain-containing protein [Candidatus Omnitrophota bacterium]|nr:lysylphosphatidylglycerol synthase transmembrane domain-containing protein [Candidatus Omnitrophota bacterium]